MYVIHKMFISIIAVVEPDDIIICKGGGAVFSCELNTANTNISSNNVQWYRFIKNTSATEMINPIGTDINFTTKHSESALNSTLTITNAERSYTGYYWVKSPLNDTCNVSVTVGKSM